MTLPENRERLDSEGLARLHPSTFEMECKQLRAEIERLKDIVPRAYAEGWSHGAVAYGETDFGKIERGRELDWLDLAWSRAALQRGPRT